MKRLVKTAALISSLVVLGLSAASTFAQQTQSATQRGLNIDQVLKAARDGAAKDRRASTARENQFKAERTREQGRLNSMRNERVRQERISDELERQFEQNNVRLEELQEELSRELGDLKQLFGNIQLSASEAQEEYRSSLISAQYPERAENLRQMVEKMASLTELVSIDEIEDLWVQLQNEMTEQGKVVKFNVPVKYIVDYKKDDDGNLLRTEQGNKIPVYEERDKQVTRVGVFNAVAGDDIITYDDKLGFVALERQMVGDFNKLSNGLQNSSNGINTFLLDPERGGLLRALVQKPSIQEKVDEGGIVGYVIIGLGALALLIALLRFVILLGVESAVKKQARNIKKPSLQNPLGRMIKVYQDNPNSDPESIELKLGEAMLKESQKINSWAMFVKIASVVAPLLGLLGTVTGMIQTFQAITLYGAGDPQTMAGGISQALVTTVLGLVVAIPAVFAHWMVSNRAGSIEAVLEEQAAGLVAEKYESQA